MLFIKLISKNLFSFRNIRVPIIRKIMSGESNLVKIKDDTIFNFVRLPNTDSFYPTHYNLSLKPNFSDFTFSGSVEIDLVKKDNAPSISDIVLHVSEIEIHSGSFKTEDGETPLTKVTYGEENGMAKLNFFNTDNLSAGVLKLNYSGILNDKMKGFYRTSWKADDKTCWAAVTQFESTDARCCLPCWDEPAVKATFSVEMKVCNKLKNFIALSNMPIISHKEEDDCQVYVFDKSPKMSTYLLAFAVGPFEYISGKDNKNREIRVYVTPGKLSQAPFSLDVAIKSLEFYEEYFKIEYPLPKMDLIAIPDFSSGAMENWGLVTYRETCLLVDEKETSTLRKQYVALVVAHELAHQWFGNLVTMEWWTHLWLNEGFATFLEYLCVDNILPEYDIWSQFVTDSFMSALHLDAMKNSHPIEVPVNDPSEISEIFDQISYEKGASVIRMLHQYIGDDAFREGLTDYMLKFQYDNAKTEDLWTHLGLAAKKPVKDVMHCWTSQKGYPWISVESEQKGSNISLKLTQHQFTADGKLGNDQESMWMIPVSVVTANGKKLSLLLDKKETVVELTDVDSNTWVKLNPGTVSLFRTVYSEDLFKRFSKAVQDKSMAPMDRLGLEADYSAFCQAGKVSTVELLKLLAFYKFEDNYTVWNSIDSSVGEVNFLFDRTDFSSQLKKLLRAFYEDIFKKTGWIYNKDEPHTMAMTRTLVINRLVSLDDQDVIAEVIRLYRDQINKDIAIPADLKGAVYRAVSSFGNEEDYENLYKLYRSSEIAEEQNRICRALGLSKDPQRVQRALMFVMSNEVRNQDKHIVIRAVGSNDQDAAFSFLKQNRQFFLDTYSSGHILPHIVKSCTENFKSLERADEVEEYFIKNPFKNAERSCLQAVESIRLHAEWVNRDLVSVKEYLKQQQQ